MVFLYSYTAYHDFEARLFFEDIRMPAKEHPAGMPCLFKFAYQALNDKQKIFLSGLFNVLKQPS